MKDDTKTETQIETELLETREDWKMPTTDMTTTKKTELAPVKAIDPLAAYADAVAPQYIVGEMLRFSKGDWLVGTTDVAVGTKYTVAPTELMAGWVKWFNNKPVDHAMVRVDDGVAPKLRPELGDHDTAQWEVDKTTKEPRDPWNFTNYLPMMNDKGEIFTFTTNSRGGINAIAKLVRMFARHRKRHPNVFPLIAIGTDSYQHKDPQRGRIKFPVFEPAGYVPKAEFLAALESAGFTAVELAPEDEPEAADPADDMSDEVLY